MRSAAQSQSEGASESEHPRRAQGGAAAQPLSAARNSRRAYTLHTHCRTYTAGTAEADICFLRARQAGGQGGLFYNDFVQLCVDVCVRAAGGRVGGAARRLEQRAPRAAADGDEESEEQPCLDEQLRTLLSRMVTDANNAVAA